MVVYAVKTFNSGGYNFCFWYGIVFISLVSGKEKEMKLLADIIGLLFLVYIFGMPFFSYWLGYKRAGRDYREIY